MSKEITPKGEDYSQWYLDVVLKTDMADYGPVKGCMIIKPYGYAVWEHMQRGHGPAHQGDRPRQRLLPALHPQELPREGEGARRGLLSRVRLGHGGGRGGARGAARHPSHVRGHDLLDVREVGPLLARPPRPHQPVGERGALGEGDAALPAHDGIPLAGGAHAARHGGGGRGRDAQDARRLSQLLRRDARDARAHGPKDRQREVRGGAPHLRDRGAHGGRPGPAGGYEPQPRASTSRRPTASSSSTRTSSGRSRGPLRGAPPRA